MKKPWQLQVVATTNFSCLAALLRNCVSSVVLNAPMPGAIWWLVRKMAVGYANFISLSMVQGFFVCVEGHVSGASHFCMQFSSLL